MKFLGKIFIYKRRTFCKAVRHQMKLKLAKQIKNLKRSGPFPVQTEGERVKVLQAAKTLRDAGVIDFTVTTRAMNGAFLVIAI